MRIEAQEAAWRHESASQLDYLNANGRHESAIKLD